MNKEEVYEYCNQIRLLLENIPSKQFDSSSSLYSAEFPFGCCDDVSQILATLIYDTFGVIPSLYRGEAFSAHPKINTHVWLQAKGWIIDITLDQFNDYGYDFPSVYVGDPIDFYDYFKTTREIDGRHESGSDRNALSGAYELLKDRLQS